MSQSGGPNESERIPQSNNDVTAMVETPYKEEPLANLGFNSTDSNSICDRIVQPRKADILVLLDRIRMKTEKTDIQIHIGTTVFHCHLMLLQYYSDVFMDLANEQVVLLPPEKVTPHAFAMVYDWMLASNPKVQRKGLVELYNVAKFLGITLLEDQCWVCLNDGHYFAMTDQEYSWIL